MSAPRFSRIIETRKGLFGDIVVYDFAGRRWFDNSNAVQGASYLDPVSTEVVDSLAVGPGPVQGCTYSLGWLLAGVCAPTGRGVMFGMGSGEGAVSLLYHFPRLSLDVVDPDPAVFGLAYAHYPLVRHFIESGRLRPIEDWAEHHVTSRKDMADFVIFDIDDRANLVSPLLHDADFLVSLLGCGRALWINLLSDLHNAAVQQVLRELDMQGRPIRCHFSCKPRTGNTIATTVDVDIAALSRFKPYATLAGPAAAEMQRRYADLIRSASVQGVAFDA